MQDDTQRPDAPAAPAPAAPQPQTTPQPQPTPPPTAPANPAPSPAPQGPATPRGLESLRADSGVETRGFGSLGLGTGLGTGLGSTLSAEPREPLPFHTDLDTSHLYGYDHVEHQEPMYLPLALSVGAGFKFGCGFMLAVGVSLFGLFLAASVIFFVAALAGVPGLPGSTP